MTEGDPRAVVADDSHFMQRVITDVLEAGGVEIAGVAGDGREAVELVVETEPDVVTMDVEMPEMNGLDAVEAIMARRPTPILMLSAHTDADADVTFEALDRGAVDFFRKPGGGEVSTGVSAVDDQLVAMVRSVAGADVTDAGSVTAGATGETDAVAGVDRSTAPAPSPPTEACDGVPTLVVGSSTGGPKVVERLLAELPREANFRVLVVQHMPEGFTERFAERIDGRSDYDVREATDGDRIEAGEALVAAGDSHLSVVRSSADGLAVACTDEGAVNGVRPSVDVTMTSAADVVDGPLVGVVLTGMGKDGAEGVERIAAAGGRTIAQDEATSAVYGMPRRAVETGAVGDVLPIDEIAGRVVDVAAEEADPR